MGEKMYAYQCRACGQLHHPAHVVCKQCGAREFAPVPVEGPGTLLTFTRVYNLPEGYMKPFIAFGMVEFSNGLRVCGQMDSNELEIGMPVQATVGVVKEAVGKDCWGFVFQKAD